jgi:hypothetical protein
LKRWKRDFKKREHKESFYDIYEDWGLIEASFSMQYGIRLRRDDMSWGEFCTLLSGLGEETPLGKTVNIRAERDPKVIRKFTPEQRRIYYEWKKRQMREIRNDPKRYKAYVDNLQNAFRAMCGNTVTQ